MIIWNAFEEVGIGIPYFSYEYCIYPSSNDDSYEYCIYPSSSNDDSYENCIYPSSSNDDSLSTVSILVVMMIAMSTVSTLMY